MSREKLTFAMGCFWGPEDRFARIPGVTGTRVGYAGGEAVGRPDGTESEAAPPAPPQPQEAASPSAQPEPQQAASPSAPPAPTHRRLRGHSEVVEVEFDPEVVSLEELLRRFWSEHNPAAIEGYKPEDSRYRSLLLYRSEEQRAVMERVRRETAEQGRSGEATGLKPLGDFYPAEEKHQRYEEKKRLRNGGSESSARKGD